MKQSRKKILAAVLLVLVLIVAAVYVCNRPEPVKSPVVVFDTDVGTDDAAALLVSCIASKPIFDYIIASQGNTTLDGATQNAVVLKKRLGLTAVIVQGMPPEADDNVNADEKNTFHGNDGLANIRTDLIGSLGLTERETDNYMTFENFVDEASGFDEIIYIAVGPTTNLANLIEHDNIKSKISKVYIMGGGINEFNCSNDTEFNFSKDPKSVQKILDSGLDITLFPLDLTNHQRLSSEQIDALEKSGNYPEYITFFRYNLLANTDYNNISAAILHDTMPVLYYIRPEAFRIEDMTIAADQYGATKSAEDGALIHVAAGVDKSLLESCLSELFSNQKQR